MNKERSTFPIFVKAAFFMLSLLVVLGVLTSMTTGISLFNKEVMGLISTIYIMSLVILGVLALTVFLAAIFSITVEKISV